MKVISLGWGVQSFTLAAMAALGEVESVDVAIHVDTTHEKSWTYEFAARWTPWLEEHGVRVVTVWPNKFDDVIMIPAFTQSDSGRGQLRRQCTGHWKIVPMRRWLQVNREKQPVEQWIGISTDESLRMKSSDVQYITHRWPLIELGMSREDCERWLEDHGLEVPFKSACVFCPYQSKGMWQKVKASGNGDWTSAVKFDKAIRKVRPPFDLYIHQARKPLDQIDMRTEQEKGQIDLFSEECYGICGV
jgi:hypothetical protein